MPAVDFTTPLPPLSIGATGIDAVAQNIRVIVTTLAWSVPLDRAFANTGTYIDAPTPYAVARKIAELTEAIEAREPRVHVTKISFAEDGEGHATRDAGPSGTSGTEATMQGRLYPRISFELKQGVEL